MRVNKEGFVKTKPIGEVLKQITDDSVPEALASF